MTLNRATWHANSPLTMLSFPRLIMIDEDVFFMFFLASKERGADPLEGHSVLSTHIERKIFLL